MLRAAVAILSKIPLTGCTMRTVKEEKARTDPVLSSLHGTHVSASTRLPREIGVLPSHIFRRGFPVL